MTGRQQPVLCSFVIIFTPSAKRHTLKKRFCLTKRCEECIDALPRWYAADIQSSEDNVDDKGTRCSCVTHFSCPFYIEPTFCRQQIGFECRRGNT